LKIGKAILNEPLGKAPIHCVRAWVNFRGISTITIRNSSNISSVQRLALGRYKVNLVHEAPNANYSIQITNAQGVGNIGGFDRANQSTPDVYFITPTSFEFGTSDATSNIVYDVENCLVTCVWD
jgi:hypothetical protein